MKLNRHAMATAFALGACAAFGEDIAIKPGDTFNWAAESPAGDAKIYASGGTIDYSLADGQVSNQFTLAGPVAFNLGDGASVRFLTKWFREGTGKMTFNGPVTFGSANSGVFAFLPEDAVAFTDEALAADAKLTLKGYPSMSVFPDKWAHPVPFEYASGVYVTLYGPEMWTGDRIVLPKPATGSIYYRFTNVDHVPVGSTVVVPSNTTMVLRRMKFDPETNSGAAWTQTTAHFTNKVELTGGTLKVDNSSQHHIWGEVTGFGKLEMGDSSEATRYINASLDKLSGDSVMTLLAKKGSDAVRGHNAATRLLGSFPGRVILNETSPSNVVSIGFHTVDLKYPTNGVYRLGSLKCANVDGNGLYGSRLQYNIRQKIIIDKLEGSAIAAYASATANSCALEIGLLKDATIWIKNGLRVKIDATAGYPRLRYMDTQVSTNHVTLAAGCTLDQIHLPTNGTVSVSGNGVVSAVTGVGTLEIHGGVWRVGRSDQTAKVKVLDGAKVTFGGGADLSVLLGAKPALWLDASATENMVGAWNGGWAKTDAGKAVLAAHPAVTLNGASAATYTNGYPLIEKWYDKRPAQRLNYGWQDRCWNYGSTLYTLVYPYLVKDGLNGRPYMSFGAHGTVLDTATFGTGGSSGDEKSTYKQELRRMPLMQDQYEKGKPEGHAINVSTAIMVFGSQNGGGRAILGGYQGSDEAKISTSANGRANWTTTGDDKHNPQCGNNYGRGGASSCYDVTNAIFATARKTFVDETEVDPTKTGLNGGWQIIAVNGGKSAFRSLGMSSRYIYSGGQNYAELLVYTNELATVERRTVEAYLARKWNLPGGLAVQGPVEVAAGCEASGGVMSVSGEGKWIMDTPEASFPLDGTFKGILSGAADLTSEDVVGLADDFTGSVKVTGSELHFTYADGKFTNAMVADGAKASFPSSAEIKLSFGGVKPAAGKYTLVSVGTLEGLDGALTVTGDCPKATYELRRVGNALELSIYRLGATLLVK